MAEANHHYYTHHIAFGESGDFYTSPEISPFFGELIGLSFVDIWQKMGAPDDLILIELGPGKGTLMSDILRVGEKYWGRPKVHLVENSPKLRGVQAETLKGVDVAWHDRFEDIGVDKPFLLVANEFFDALPVRHVREREGVFEEKFVEDGKEIWEACHNVREGARLEHSPLTTAIFTQILEALKGQSGYALIIDYGYVEAPEGPTVQAYRGNKRVSIYDQPGKTDLSAYVDFEHLSALAEQHYIYGPVTQAQYLTQLGLETRVGQVLDKVENPHKILRSARILIDPVAMGGIFKVLGVASQDFGILPGFG